MSQFPTKIARKFNAITFCAPGEIEMRAFELPQRGPDESVVKTLYTLISSGTEGRVLAGHYGAAGHFPLIPGYAAIGQRSCRALEYCSPKPRTH